MMIFNRFNRSAAFVAALTLISNPASATDRSGSDNECKGSECEEDSIGSNDDGDTGTPDDESVEGPVNVDLILAEVGVASLAELDNQFSVFRRGDANDDGSVNVGDAVFLSYFLFGGGGAPLCDDASDANDDGAVNLSDMISILNNLFVPEYFDTIDTSLGLDRTDDLLTCYAQYDAPASVCSADDECGDWGSCFSDTASELGVCVDQLRANSCQDADSEAYLLDGLAECGYAYLVEDDVWYWAATGMAVESEDHEVYHNGQVVVAQQTAVVCGGEPYGSGPNEGECNPDATCPVTNADGEVELQTGLCEPMIVNEVTLCGCPVALVQEEEAVVVPAADLPPVLMEAGGCHFSLYYSFTGLPPEPENIQNSSYSQVTADNRLPYDNAYWLDATNRFARPGEMLHEVKRQFEGHATQRGVNGSSGPLGDLFETEMGFQDISTFGNTVVNIVDMSTGGHRLAWEYNGEQTGSINITDLEGQWLTSDSYFSGLMSAFNRVNGTVFDLGDVRTSQVTADQLSDGSGIEVSYSTGWADTVSDGTNATFDVGGTENLEGGALGLTNGSSFPTAEGLSLTLASDVENHGWGPPNFLSPGASSLNEGLSGTGGVDFTNRYQYWWQSEFAPNPALLDVSVALVDLMTDPFLTGFQLWLNNLSLTSITNPQVHEAIVALLENWADETQSELDIDKFATYESDATITLRCQSPSSGGGGGTPIATIGL